MRWQGESRRKETGGRLKRHRKKRKHECGRPVSETSIDEERKRYIRTRGGNEKIRLYRANMANVVDKSGVMRRVRIETVLNNPANQHYSRRNIITKGAIIKTEIGDAMVTSRPGQDGIVNAVLQ
jgi:small subunit ribosomal protein S8e